MARMSWQDFRKALRVANPRLVFLGNSPTLASMVYLTCPGHPDAVEGTDLIEVLAIASPTFFRQGCPAEDGVEIVSGKQLWFRGYKNFFKQLAKKKGPHGEDIVRSVDSLKQVTPSGTFDRKNHRAQKNDWLESIKGEPSEFEKKRQWLKERSKPIPGNGMPLAWKREKLYSMGGTDGGLDYQRV